MTYFPKVKIAILTSLCGNKENLVNPTVIHDGVDYFAFVDEFHENAGVWDQLEAHHFSEDKNYFNRRNAKVAKILHQLLVPNYDYYIWVDVSHDVIQAPFEIREKYLSNHDIACFKHTSRNCAYQEALEVARLGLEELDVLERQLSFYKSVGFPEEYGLFELSTFAIKNTPNNLCLSLKWWELICKFSSRDQISFPFALWKLGINPAILPGFANGLNAMEEIGNNPLMPQVRKHVGGVRSNV